jgi:4-diphosphocytidyl-2-C-methyl-D-erythritol kinase
VTPAPAHRPPVIHRLAAAKINLTLHVTGKRADGYHLLDSLIVFTDFGDQLEVTPDDDLAMELGGPFGAELAAAGANEDNLVMRAARMLAARQVRAGASALQGARIKLIKYLPIASGVGGGSADAAATLRALSDHWGLSLPQAELMALGLELGADVPACLASAPVHMTGIGDHVERVADLPAFYLALVNPRIPLSTAQVFGTLRPETFVTAPPPCPPVKGLDQLVRELEQRRNDLEAAAVNLVPEIADILAVLLDQPGCRMSRMSGSGATCFGIFPDLTSASSDARQIKTAHRQWWTAAGAVL